MSIGVKNELDGGVSAGARRHAMTVEMEKGDTGAADARRPNQDALPQYDTGTLFAGRREIVIRHAGADYRMKITKQGKLILNK